MLRNICKFIANLVFNVARNAAGAASTWSTYEPQEPECLIDMNK